MNSFIDDRLKGRCALALGKGEQPKECPEAITAYFKQAEATLRSFCQGPALRADLVPIVFLLAKMQMELDALKVILHEEAEESVPDGVAYLVPSEKTIKRGPGRPKLQPVGV